MKNLLKQKLVLGFGESKYRPLTMMIEVTLYQYEVPKITVEISLPKYFKKTKLPDSSAYRLLIFTESEIKKDFDEMDIISFKSKYKFK